MIPRRRPFRSYFLPSLHRWNCDFSKVGRCPLRRINELEVAVLQVLQYNVRVASSLFARWYSSVVSPLHVCCSVVEVSFSVHM